MRARVECVYFFTEWQAQHHWVQVHRHLSGVGKGLGTALEAHSYLLLRKIISHTNACDRLLTLQMRWTDFDSTRFQPPTTDILFISRAHS